jgi:hypothetical protein
MAKFTFRPLYFPPGKSPSTHRTGGWWASAQGLNPVVFLKINFTDIMELPIYCYPSVDTNSTGRCVTLLVLISPVCIDK